MTTGVAGGYDIFSLLLSAAKAVWVVEQVRGILPSYNIALIRTNRRQLESQYRILTHTFIRPIYFGSLSRV